MRLSDIRNSMHSPRTFSSTPVDAGNPPYNLRTIAMQYFRPRVHTRTLHRNRNEMTILVVSSFEKRVREDDAIDLFHLRVVHEIVIQKEEYWHVNLVVSPKKALECKDLLSGSQFLFFETEALYFVEIRSHLSRIDLKKISVTRN